MGISIFAVHRTVAAHCLLFILLFSSQVVHSLQNNKIRCNPGQISYDTASTKCPIHQICSAQGVCELIGQDLARVQRKRHFNPIPNAAERSITSKEGRCGEHFGVARCDSKSKFRPCCSRREWCGSSPADCLPENGCQQGCILDPELTVQRRETRENVTEQTSEPLINTNPFPARVGKPLPAPKHEAPGEFKISGDSGVPAMHAALVPNGNVVFLDKIENYTKLQFDNGDLAYSSEWDPISGKITPLAYKTNAFCCGGTFLASGTLVSVGGNGPLPDVAPSVSNGFDKIRYLTRSSSPNEVNAESWSEPGNVLASRRWYASVQTMADGSVFVASGSLNGLDPTKSKNNNPTYEILDRNGVSFGVNVQMQILVKNQPYYMYPFLHLLRDGSIFVFTATSSQLFDVANNEITKDLPDLEGMYRTYPNTGGSVLLPLSPDNYEPEVVICGGGAYQDLASPTDPSCGRIKPLDKSPKWEMDAMPEGRGMVEGILLPDGTVLWLNGAQRGAQGFGIANTPALEALIYDPMAKLGKRWSRAGTSQIPRLYHSVALLLLDGTVMVAGSNPNEMPILAEDVDPNDPARAFPTEFRIEIYTPPYLMGDRAEKRPDRVSLSKDKLTVDGSTFEIKFRAPKGAKEVKVSLYHGGFVTHALHMGHRMVWLEAKGWKEGGGMQRLRVSMPVEKYGNRVLPPGPYVVYVVVDGVPAVGKIVSVG